MELAGQADKPAAQAPAATSAVQQVSQQPAAQIQQPMASVAPGASALAPAVAAQLLQNPQVMCCHSLQLATLDAAGAVALPRSLECEWQACALADSGGCNSNICMSNGPMQGWEVPSICHGHGIHACASGHCLYRSGLFVNPS